MGVLRNINDERFAQLVVAGKDPGEAYQAIGGKAKHASFAASRKMDRPEVRKRINELLDVNARRAQLSRMQILERVFDDWESSRRLGQMTAALTAARMLGSELHRGMFVDRKEVGGPGDFDKLNAQELMDYIKKELAEIPEAANELGIKLDEIGKVTLLPPAKASDDNQGDNI